MSEASGITDTGTLETAKDVRDFLIANDHVYGMGLIEALKRRVGVYEELESRNATAAPASEEPDPEPEVEVVAEEETAEPPEESEVEEPSQFV